MYLEYWGFSCPPFRNNHDLKFLHISSTVSEALVRLTYAVDNVFALATLVGIPGVGKTMVLHELRAHLERTGGHVALLNSVGGSTVDLLSSILKAFGRRPAWPSPGSLLDQLRQLASENCRLRRCTTLVLDEAHYLGDASTLAVLRSLTNLEYKGARLLSVILSGQLELGELVATSPVLRQRLELKAHLDPLSREETGEYVSARLASAGAQANPFTVEALDEMFVASRGIPRQINLLADMALLNAAGESLDRIGKETIAAARTELCGATAPS